MTFLATIPTYIETFWVLSLKQVRKCIAFQKNFLGVLGDSDLECFANTLTGSYEFYPTDCFSTETFCIKYVYTCFYWKS